ncbi:MAG: serine/threonine protein kinase [Nitrospirae bacterium]|nr:serine/threonine protein kinase [Nitrospirota bacterium]
MSDIQKIGKYEIISKIADGGMGTVYKAKDTSFDERYVALKVMKPEHSKDADMRVRFRREAEKSVKITHPNVVKVTDYGIEDGIQYIVMEYIDGEDLGKRLKKRGALSWEEAVRNIINIASVIDNAHEKGIIHRDIKPGNILLDKKGHVFVTDFGIAVALQDPRITATDEFFGSAAYMSPEHHLGKDIDRRSDIYSLGIVLYEMLTNTVPFIGNTPASTGIMHATTPPIPPKRLNPAVPDWLNDIVMKSLEKEPGKRFSNCNEFIKHLTDRKIQKPLPLYLLTLSGMVILLIIVVLLLLKESKPSITTAMITPAPQPTLSQSITPAAAPVATTAAPVASQAEEPAAVSAPAPEFLGQREKERVRSVQAAAEKAEAELQFYLDAYASGDPYLIIDTAGSRTCTQSSMAASTGKTCASIYPNTVTNATSYPPYPGGISNVLGDFIKHHANKGDKSPFTGDSLFTTTPGVGVVVVAANGLNAATITAYGSDSTQAIFSRLVLIR